MNTPSPARAATGTATTSNAAAIPPRTMAPLYRKDRSVQRPSPFHPRLGQILLPRARHLRDHVAVEGLHHRRRGAGGLVPRQRLVEDLEGCLDVVRLEVEPAHLPE